MTTTIGTSLFRPARQIIRNGYSERVSDCCLTPIQQFFQLYNGENKLIVNVLDLVGFILL